MGVMANLHTGARSGRLLDRHRYYSRDIGGYLREDLAAGLDEERFEFGPDEITLDVVLGLILMSIHRIVRGDAGPDHAERLLERVLAILGVAKDEARTLATEAVTDQRRITN